MKRTLATFATVGFFVYAQFAGAAMSSTNYQIRWDTVNTGGSDTSSSATYLLKDSVTDVAGFVASSTTYQITDGYRAGIFDQIISFDLYIQNSSAETEILAVDRNTYTVTSSVGLSVGNYVAIVQDRGESQIVGFGRIQGLMQGPDAVTVDRLTIGGSTPAINGLNDFLYPLTSSSLALETISDTSVGTGVVGFEVTADVDDGYVIQILEDGNLRNGLNDINDVTDGAVTAGSEEFGLRSSDSTLANSAFDTSDAAVTSTAQDIVTQSTYAIDNRSFVTFKLSASSSTPSTTYTNITTFIASGLF